MKLIAITIASVLALTVNAVDLTLCIDAYFVNCATTTNVKQGECLSAAAQPQFNWPGFKDNSISSYKQVNSGTGQCYYFADAGCNGLMFNVGDSEDDWLGLSGNNDQLSSIFCTKIVTAQFIEQP